MPNSALTSKAQSDLEGVYEHYQAVGGAQRARQAVLHMLDRLQALEQFPHPGIASIIPDCRELVFSRYPFRVVYRLQAGTLLVYRILHQHGERGTDAERLA